MHPNLQPLGKNELNKLLAAKIIFPVIHSQWVVKLVPIRKKNGDILFCVDFCDPNRASDKDNYYVPLMEQVLSQVVGLEDTRPTT